MIVDFLKSLLVGICAAAPLGPIALLVIQKCFSKGRRSGFVTGLGALTVDTIYATIALFAISYAEDFMESNQCWIFLVGGVILAVLGTTMMLSNPFRKLSRKQARDKVSPTDYLKAVAMGFSNPGAILVIFALLAFFGLGTDGRTAFGVASIIIGVATGELLYWFCVTGLLVRLRKGINFTVLVWVNRVAGAAVAVIGVYFFVKGIIAFIPMN